MSIRKDVTVKITNNNATLDMPLQIYELDHGIELRFKLMDYKYKYTKDPQNILNSSDEDILEAYTTIINPRGYELQQINGEVKDDIVIFMIDSSYTDEIDEIGTYSLQIHIKCACSEFSIPPIQFEVLQRLKGIKVVTDGEDSIDDSALIDNYSNFISDETGKLLIEWKKGDIISSIKLNAMVEVINNAVDEEAQRQLNEVKREQQELERQNKVREALNSVDNRVDEAMTEYKTRFNSLTASQQQDMEVIDARDGEVSLKARLDRDLRNPLQVYEDVEGSYISYDSIEGYAQNVEILGNTIQNQNDLADIRSVGDKLENQELYEIPVLSTNKNLIPYNSIEDGGISSTTGEERELSDFRTKYIFITKGDYIITSKANNTTIHIAFYDKDKKFISSMTYIINKVISTPTNVSFCRIWGIKDNIEELQLERGTAATPYEPYQEDKLTILSPTPLEKVGDVADRIIYKDGVWGIEKNIARGAIFYETISSIVDNFENFTGVILTLPNMKYQNRSNVITLEGFKTFAKTDLTTIPMYSIYCNTSNLVVCFPKGTSPEDIRAHLIGRKYIYITTQPTFIPLPHDQQIKLRTFANKTNISFGCEIEATLKASVPKSLGASVNSHSEQIDNLGKELDKVKKLEESVASEVVTESDFTTVEQTSNGYFEDVKIEGRTLVNLYPKLDNKNYASLGATLSNDTITINANGSWKNFMIKKDVMPLKTSTYYTFVIYIIDNTITGDNAIIHFGETLPKDDPTKFIDSYHFSLKNKKGIYAFKLKTKDSFDNVGLDTRDHLIDKATSGTIVFKYMILEGDHTQNPPEYFEGIKSVGQDVDEISVESMVENIVKYRKKTVKSDGYACDFESISSNDVYYHNLSNKNIRLHIKKDDTYVKNIIIPPKTTIQHELSDGNVTYSVSLTLGFGWKMQEYDIDRIFAITRKNLADKKPILYYNPTTNTWEKPVLREWDTIEKHSDGKYYYHKRSGEVVLNSDEKYDWYYYSYGGFGTDIPNLKRNISGSEITSYSISNSLTPVTYNELSSVGSGYYSVHYTVSRIVISSDCKTTDEFEDWLRSNPVIIVYQLETEEVYECTNIDLITYENETNFIVNAGAIAPLTTLKVMCNINNVVRELQQKVSNLENYIQHVMIDALNNALNE